MLSSTSDVVIHTNEAEDVIENLQQKAIKPSVDSNAENADTYREETSEESKPPARPTTITIFILMHGREFYRESLPNTTISHSLINPMGKLGCLNYMLTINGLKKEIKKYQLLYKDRLITSVNKEIEKNEPPQNYNIRNLHIDPGWDKFGETIATENKEYHLSGLQTSSFKTRVLGHPKTYSLDVTDPLEGPLGIYVIETANIKNSNLDGLFNDLKTMHDDNFIFNNNILRFNNMRNILATVPSDEIPDIAKRPFVSTDYPGLSVSIFNPNTLLVTTEEHTTCIINRVELLEIILFFQFLGFNHVNIIDYSCRGSAYMTEVDNFLPNPGRSGTAPNVDELIRRRKSFLEKKNGEESNEKNHGGSRTKKERKRKKRKKTKKKKENEKNYFKK